MDPKEAGAETRDLLSDYDPADVQWTAAGLRGIWLQAVPPPPPDLSSEHKRLVQSLGYVDPGYQVAGTPVPVLNAMGKEMGKTARRQVSDYLPLTRLLWDQYGREGRIVSVVALGPMELADPAAVVPAIHDMARTCVAWEDCDQLAMKALEPVLRKDPESWLDRLGTWVLDGNKWVRRAGLTAIGRLPMKEPQYTARCVELEAPALGDPDTDVKRALSFALRLNARGEVPPVKGFVVAHRNESDAHSVWVMCDLIRSMWEVLLPQFVELLPIYQAWLETAEPKARRSVQAAIGKLESVM